MQTLQVNGQSFDLYFVTGKVEEAGKNMETKISGGGGGGFTYRGTGGTAPVNIQSKTVVHDQVFLTDDAGTEHAFQLQGFNLACRSGNKLTVLSAVKKGRKAGPYLAVYNHSTSTVFFNDKMIAAFFRRPVGYLLGTFALLFLLGAVASFFYWLLPVAFVWWLMEGETAKNRFKNNINFNQFNHTAVEAGRLPV